MYLKISNNFSLPLSEINLTATRSQGAGGQNVNKVSTAIHLRFSINDSSLSPFYKERLLKLNDQRITSEGVIVIKAQKHRTQEKNRQDALQRLARLIKSVSVVKKKRVATKPTKASQHKRIKSKKNIGNKKRLRGRISQDD